MLEIKATTESLRKIIRLSVKHSLTVDDEVYAAFDRIPRMTKIENFNYTLRTFQSEGVAWLEKQGGTGILADEPGTGKTVQVIAFAHKNHMFPMLVVCPNTLKLNWRNEIIAMTGQLYRINVVGKEYSKRQTLRRAERHPNVIYSKVPTAGCDIYIVNYDILAANVDEFEALGLRYMAVDESHKIKNPEAKRTKAMLRLAVGEWDEKQRGGQRKRIKIGDGIQAVTLMSGTPAVNRPVELWTSVQTVAPWVPEFSKFTRFGFRYCGAQQNGHGWDFTGATNTGELNSLLTRHCMLRRLKADVLQELPPKIYRTLPLEFDRREYDRIAAAFKGINWQAGMQAIVRMGGNVPKSDEAIVAIQKLREMAGYAKLDSAVEWIQDYCETNSKLVVFAHNRKIIERVKNALEEAPEYANAVGVIYGGITDDARADAVSNFQNDPRVRVIIIGITAGGFGLTLTSASAVAFLQLPWTPGEISQCMDRVHRIGQEANQVTCYNLVAEGTIEEEMSEMLFAKGQILDAVLDGGRVINAIQM